MIIYDSIKCIFIHNISTIDNNRFIFFRIVFSEPQTPAQPLDYNFAREEFMLNELSNDPIQTAIAKMEKQHEEDKQGSTTLHFVYICVNRQ